MNFTLDATNMQYPTNSTFDPSEVQTLSNSTLDALIVLVH
jgi:hypothetical protein